MKVCSSMFSSKLVSFKFTFKNYLIFFKKTCLWMFQRRKDILWGEFWHLEQITFFTFSHWKKLIAWVNLVLEKYPLIRQLGNMLIFLSDGGRSARSIYTLSLEEETVSPGYESTQPSLTTDCLPLLLHIVSLEEAAMRWVCESALLPRAHSYSSTLK